MNWEERKGAHDRQRLEVAGALAQMEAHLGGIASLIKAPPANDVLGQLSRQIPPSGVDVVGWPTTLGALTIANHSPAAVTIGGGSSVSSPVIGAGVWRVAPGYQRTMPAKGNEIAVHGNPGSLYELVAYSRPRPAVASRIGVSTGGVLIGAGASKSTTAQISTGALGLVAVVLNVSAVSGGETVQLAINGLTPTGYSYPLLAPAAVGATGTTPYRIGPALTPSPGAVADDLVPAVVQVVATVAGAGAIAYGVDLVAA